MVGASDKEHRSPEIERTMRLGESLVLRGKLTREQLRVALEIKENDPQRLDEILLSQKLVSGEDLAQAVAEATGFEYVSLTEGSVDPAAVSILSEKVLRKHMALPLRIEDGCLVLAMSDPTNVLALDDLKALAGYPVRPVVAAEKSIRNLQDRVFGIQEEIHEFLEAEEGVPTKPSTGGTLSISQGDEGAPVIRLDWWYR